EIRSKIPVGTGVWPAFWMLANDGGWPPEIDVMEGRGQQPGDLVMTTHWRIPETQKIISCGFDFQQPDAAIAFHDYGVLWTQDRIIYFIDRRPVADIKVPVGFDDGETPRMVEFQIDRVSAYQLDPYQPDKTQQGSAPIKASLTGDNNGR